MLAYAWLIFAIAGLFSWFPLTESFSMAYIGDTYLVPWFFHPVRLGAIGLLWATVIIKKHWQNDILIFLYLLFASFITGRAVSFINVNFFRSEYWEWRFLFFSFAAASVMSTLILKHLGAQAEKMQPKQSLRQVSLCSFLMGLLVLSGVSSTFLTLEHAIYNVREIDEQELNAISFLSSTLLNRKPSPLLTVTRQSASTLKLVPSPWVEKSIQPIIWSPKYPEVPLTFIHNLRFPSPYIYLHQRDLDIITSTWLQDGYIAKHFLQLMTEMYTNSKVKIYEQLPEAVPPLHNGKTVLVLPLNETFSRNNPVATHILSLGGYNYTTMLDSDPMIFERDILLFPSDSITPADISKLEFSNEKKILILNSDGYGSLSRVFFESQENEASIDVKSGESVFVHSLINHTLGLTSISELLFDGGVEFVIYNNEQKINYKSIVDDDQVAFWTSTGGMGEGAVSAPFLARAPSMKIEGKDGLEIIIKEGDYRDWYIQHTYLTSQDWSGKDFITIWWHGANSGQTIGVVAAEIDWENYFQYTFVDNFIGWQCLAIPLKKFMRHGEPRWDSIEKLQIRSFNGGVANTWYLDSIGLEDGNDASVEVTINEAADYLELSVFDGLTQVPIPLPQNGSTTKIPANSLYFSDGSSADEIFGDEYSGEARLEKIDDMQKITFSLKLPPESSASSQSRFRVGFEMEKMNATHLVMPETEITLPLEIELTPLIQREETNVLGWYANGFERTPLITTLMFGDQVEVFYLDAYPIVRTAFSGESISQDLLQILSGLLDILELAKYDKTLTSWVIEDDVPVFAFKEGSLKGNVSISAQSLVPYEKLRLSEVHILINDSQVLLKNVVSLLVQAVEGKIALSSQNVKITDGRGFYTFISADNPEISLTGENISISALTSSGTYINAEGSAKAKLSVKGKFVTYLRSPTIYNMGNSSFREVYAFHSHFGQLRTLGQDFLIDGEVDFGLPLSDGYSIASDFTWDGTATREPPDFTWDELGSLRESITYFILAIAIFSIAWMATQKSFRIRVRRRKW